MPSLQPHRQKEPARKVKGGERTHRTTSDKGPKLGGKTKTRNKEKGIATDDRGRKRSDNSERPSRYKTHQNTTKPHHIPHLGRSLPTPPSSEALSILFHLPLSTPPVPLPVWPAWPPHILACILSVLCPTYSVLPTVICFDAAS